MRGEMRRDMRNAYVEMNGARVNSALATHAPFLERLVFFWSNHFAVSVERLPVLGLAGLLEFEAIRPNLTGRFSDMLLAVEQHPAMLLYLDQAKSVGPNSPLAVRVAERTSKHRGINENLAREILELHTLGVHSGYTQADVTEFARALTGWTIGGLARARRTPASRPRAGRVPLRRVHSRAWQPADHRPQFLSAGGSARPRGPHGRRHASVDGASYRDQAHPPLCRRRSPAGYGRAPVASLFEERRRLAHRLSRAYRFARGVGGSTAQVQTPWEWTVSAFRATGMSSVEGQMATGLLNQLGQPTWKPGSPGWDDIAPSWAAPERSCCAGRRGTACVPIGSGVDPRQLAEKLLPGPLGEPTRTAIARAESPEQGLALLLVCPEFLRR